MNQKTQFQIERFQNVCIQYGYQQAMCELKKDSNTEALLYSARIMNAGKKSLSTAIENDK